ncbi:MAG: CPBP family intramembrane glutamic endopeptidase [Allosphingosinicella sp.]
MSILPDPTRPQPIASRKHSLILTAILLAFALAGYAALLRGTAGGAAPKSGSVILYLALLAAEWGLFVYVRMGLKRHGTSLPRLISDRPLTVRTLAVDALLGLLLLGLFAGAELLLSKLLGNGNTALVQTLLVRQASLVPLWMLLAASAGFVEELTFRGYFQRQFGAWLGSPWLGVAAQAVLFGVTHGYQGGVLIVKITLFGILFGLAALLRRSLVPGMVAHAGLDMIGGLAAFR